MSTPPALARRPPVRAVIFDAGNTLIRMNYAVIARYLAGRGHRVSESDVHEAELRARVRLDADLAPGASTETGEIHRRYMAHVLDGLGIADAAEIEAIASWRRDYNRPVGLWDRADPEAASALARARAAGLATGVISNSNGSVARILEATGLGPALDFVIDSSVVGVEKPDRRIFELGLARAGVPAAAAVYVGDLYSVDVLGSRGAGLRAVLLDPRGYWGPRDCPLACGIEDAVRLCLQSMR